MDSDFCGAGEWETRATVGPDDMGCGPEPALGAVDLFCRILYGTAGPPLYFVPRCATQPYLLYAKYRDIGREHDKDIAQLPVGRAVHGIGVAPKSQGGPTCNGEGVAF